MDDVCFTWECSLIRTSETSSTLLETNILQSLLHWIKCWKLNVQYLQLHQSKSYKEILLLEPTQTSQSDLWKRLVCRFGEEAQVSREPNCLDKINNHITTSYKLTKKRSYLLLYTNFTIDLQDITNSKAFRQCVQEGPHAKQDEVLEIYRNEDVVLSHFYTRRNHQMCIKWTQNSNPQRRDIHMLHDQKKIQPEC